MIESAAHGARMINDVRALLREGAMAAALQTGLPVCLMHMQGTPQTMQNQPTYDDAVDDVYQWLMTRVDIPRRRIDHRSAIARSGLRIWEDV